MSLTDDVVEAVSAVTLGKRTLKSEQTKDGIIACAALDLDEERPFPSLTATQSKKSHSSENEEDFEPMLSGKDGTMHEDNLQNETCCCHRCPFVLPMWSIPWVRTPAGSPAWTQAPTGSPDEGEQKEDDSSIWDPVEEVDLVQNCYTLVVVSVCRLVVLPFAFITAGQIAVLYMIVWRSPEYLFAQGAWITPISMNPSLDAMKVFALLLVLFQVVAEFEEAGALFKVLTHRPAVTFPGSCFAAFVAMVVQYILTLLVLIVAVHLVLSCQRSIEPLWKTYYVFMTLNFDNMLCKFLLFAFDLTSRMSWKLALNPPSTLMEQHFTYYVECARRILFVWLPVAAILLCTIFSLAMNISPVTFLRYGYVTNEKPVLMMTPELGLPSGCCRIHTEEGASINVSVPCLSSLAPEDEMRHLLVYWVVWSTTRDPPSSLQVMEGRGGDGTLSLQSGRTPVRPLQMREWLLAHNYPNEVFDTMVSRESNVGLYRSRYAYVAEWTIPDFPRKEQAKIFAVAFNQHSGALSPKPVDSHMLSHSKCPKSCEQCGPSGIICYHCQQGFTLDQHSACRACAVNCESCRRAGPGGCDPNQCSLGHGLIGQSCLPCNNSNCLSCDASLADTVVNLTASPNAELQLPCVRCPEGHGLINGNCLRCQVEHCLDCNAVDSCDTCGAGFALDSSVSGGMRQRELETNDNASANDRLQQQCRPCAEHCASCNKLGEGHCDPLQCAVGYGGTPAGKCSPCSMHCLDCSENGGGNCDPGMCKSGYGLHGSMKSSQAVCRECIPKCRRCDHRANKCDACIEGYGLTPEGTCKACERNCKRCNEVEGCDECAVGFILQQKVCMPCADQCEHCNATGPGLCNKWHCALGWTTVPATGGFTCRPCADPRCSRCDSGGPNGRCDDSFG